MPWLQAAVVETAIGAEGSESKEERDAEGGKEDPLQHGSCRAALISAREADAWRRRVLAVMRYREGGRALEAEGLLPEDARSLRRQAELFVLAVGGVLERR